MTIVLDAQSEERKPCVLVTGATGFIGRHLCQTLSEADLRVIPVVRQLNSLASHAFTRCDQPRCIGDMQERIDWQPILGDADVVIHAAGLVDSADQGSDDTSAYYKVNVEATLDLAECAGKNGVSKFIMLSSAGVYGPNDGVAASENKICQPKEAYALSKLAAEEGLLSCRSCQAMQLVILRPPMVYGPECSGNLQRLARMVWPSIAAPFGAIDGRRNLLSVSSLCDGILCIVQDTGDASGIWNIVEPDQVSVPEIMQALGRGIYNKEVNVPVVPELLLKSMATLLGKRDVYEKLSYPVLIDGRKFSNRFDWRPTMPTLTGIEQAARSFRTQRQ